MQDQATALFPPLGVRRGVLVCDGYGIRLYVRRGHLTVEDGIGRQRRQVTLHRATSGLKRLVLLGHEGFVTLEALRWLTDVGAALVHINRNGRLLATSALAGNNDPRLRRAQARAAGTPVGIRVAREILGAKLRGQANALHRLRTEGATRTRIASAVSALETASSPGELMVHEAEAAVAYWDAWSGLGFPFAWRDVRIVPDHWRTFGKRASPLTGNPRLAANPANAILNYLYALLEAEARIACMAVGLDPGLGVLHADQRGRDSMALDVMEAARPEVDAYVLDLLEGHTFRVRDFYETRQGVCRILAPLTHHLASTIPIWRRGVAPVVERIARTLAQWKRAGRVATPLTQDNRSAGREGVRRGVRKVAVPPAATLPASCTMCAILLEDPERRLCDQCLPQQKGDVLGLASQKAVAKLASLRAQGQDPAHGGQARLKRADAITRRMQEARDFERAAGGLPDPELFRRDILPALRSVPVRAMVQATGLTRSYCSMVRRGLYVPHPRHWEALRSVAAPKAQ